MADKEYIITVRFAAAHLACVIAPNPQKAIRLAKAQLKDNADNFGFDELVVTAAHVCQCDD